jgi:tetratricopeptide (TPR) repeat protein
MHAASRALALGPNLPEAYLAQGNVYNPVQANFARAIEAYRKGLEINPAHPELLGAIGLAEQGMGNADAALDYMRRGLALDPRSLLYIRRLARLLTYLRRYDESAELIAQARALSPADPAGMMYDAWNRLGRGDLAGARAVARSIPRDRSEGSVLAFFAFDWTTAALLDASQYQALLRVTPTSFGDNRGVWGLALAGGALVHGDTVRARAYADSALPTLERMVRENPGEPLNHASLAVALALLGRKADAVQAGERAVAMRAADGFQGPGLRHTLVRIHQLNGDPVRAIAQLDTLTRLRYYISPGWLRTDPTLESLRSQPAYQAMLRTSEGR